MSDTNALRDGMAWERARLLLSASRFSRVQYLDAWPDSFTPEELACLQYPWGGTPPEKRESERLQRAFRGKLRTAIEDGEMVPVLVQVTVPDLEKRTAYIRQAGTTGQTTRGAGPRIVRTRQLVKVGETIQDLATVSRPAFAAWLRGLEPSEHIRAWLDISDEGPGLRGRQIAHIKKTASSLYDDLLNIPDGGKKQILAKCFEDYPNDFMGRNGKPSEDSFNAAWNCALDLTPPLIRMKRHKQYARRGN